MSTLLHQAVFEALLSVSSAVVVGGHICLHDENQVDNPFESKGTSR
jgi:hypothetical protein